MVNPWRRWAVYADDNEIGVVVAQDQFEAVNKAIGALPRDYPSLSSATVVARVIDAEVNVWGTDKALVDADEFCVECEHTIPGHYANCPLRPRDRIADGIVRKLYGEGE